MQSYKLFSIYYPIYSNLQQVKTLEAVGRTIASVRDDRSRRFISLF